MGYKSPYLIHDERTKILTDDDTVARRFQEQRLRLMSRRYEKKRKKTGQKLYSLSMIFKQNYLSMSFFFFLWVKYR